jgi:hypothetical protein
MCRKCDELDEKIERVRRLSSATLDQLTLDRFASLIEQYEAQKQALHPKKMDTSSAPGTADPLRC